MHKTILVKLVVKSEDKPRLQATFTDYKIAWQHVSDWIFDNKTKNRKKVHEATYKNVREIVPKLNSGLVQQARNDAISKFASIKNNRHKINCAPKLKNVSLRFDNRTSSLKGNILSLAVNGGKRIKTELVDFSFLQIHRTYKTLAPLVFYRDGDFWVALTFEIPEQLGTSGPIMGVDMGLRILVATSEGKLIRGNKMNRLRRKIRHVKGILQRKGTKSAKRHLKRLRRKEQRQSRDVIHCAVNEVLKTDASIIGVENLDLRAKKYRKSSNRRRFSVPLSEFVRVLEYKSRLRGKQVLKVKPNFTSQDDCRGLERGERIGGKYVGKDGVILHADKNAACNIALRTKETFKLDNPVSVCYHSNMIQNINRQGAVNHPIVSFGNLQASMALA